MATSKRLNRSAIDTRHGRTNSGTCSHLSHGWMEWIIRTIPKKRSSNSMRRTSSPSTPNRSPKTMQTENQNRSQKTPDNPAGRGWMRRLVVRPRLWMCAVFGHSFSSIDALKFKIETAARRYTVNTLTGERRPWEGKPEIKCRRCGECFAHNSQDR